MKPLSTFFFSPLLIFFFFSYASSQNTASLKEIDVAFQDAVYREFEKDAGASGNKAYKLNWYPKSRTDSLKKWTSVVGTVGKEKDSSDVFLVRQVYKTPSFLTIKLQAEESAPYTLRLIEAKSKNVLQKFEDSIGNQIIDTKIGKDTYLEIKSKHKAQIKYLLQIDLTSPEFFQNITQETASPIRRSSFVEVEARRDAKAKLRRAIKLEKTNFDQNLQAVSKNYLASLGNEDTVDSFLWKAEAPSHILLSILPILQYKGQSIEASIIDKKSKKTIGEFRYEAGQTETIKPVVEAYTHGPTYIQFKTSSANTPRFDYAFRIIEQKLPKNKPKSVALPDNFTIFKPAKIEKSNDIWLIISGVAILILSFFAIKKIKK